MELLIKSVPIAVLIFVVSSTLAVGLSITIEGIVTPLRSGRLVSMALLANFVLMPLGALALEKVLQLDSSLGVGLLLVASGAGGPILPKLAQIAKTGLGFAVGLMVLLMVVTIVYMPLVLPWLLEGVSVHPWKIARSLIFMMLLPLAVGLGLRVRYQVAADRVRPLVDRVSTLSLFLLIVLLFVTSFSKVMGIFGTRGILGGISLILLGVVLGHFLGGPGPESRTVLALGTGLRNVSAALLVAEQNFDDPRVVVMVVAVAAIELLILFPLARLWSKRRIVQATYFAVLLIY
jgi:BASS family bile acid:Na+ symporter